MRATILTTLFYILIFVLLINGCVHSCNKHKDDPGWLQETPLVIYRGAEYFWHDDFKGLDWDNRLSSDVYVMFDLMSKIGYTTEVETLAAEVEKFSKKINDYPKDKKEYLKYALGRFIKYSMAFSDDMVTYLQELKIGEDVNPKQWNKTSKPLEDSLVQLYEFGELKAASKGMDSIFAMITIKYRLADMESSDIEKMKNTFQQNKINQFNTYTRFYKLMFNEALIDESL